MNTTYKQNKLILLLDLILIILLVFADQFCKYLAIIKLKENKPFIIMDEVFELHYLENKGAAFGLLQNQKWFFVIVGIIFVIIAFIALTYIPTMKKYTALRTCILLIATGAIGNAIDRIRFNYVVDFLYFKYINFPIFNVADIYVTVGTILLILLILFYYKDSDLNFKEVRTVKIHTSMLNTKDNNE